MNLQMMVLKESKRLITYLESDTPHPVTKPNARQVANNRADQQKTLIRNNHEVTTEEQNEAIRQVEAHFI